MLEESVDLKMDICILYFYFSDFGIHSILFQRGIYPPESFKAEQHFGLSILVSTDSKIQQFLQTIFHQMKGTYLILFTY